jgi:hypothetical protein
VSRRGRSTSRTNSNVLEISTTAAPRRSRHGCGGCPSPGEGRGDSPLAPVVRACRRGDVPLPGRSARSRPCRRAKPASRARVRTCRRGHSNRAARDRERLNRSLVVRSPTAQGQLVSRSKSGDARRRSIATNAKTASPLGRRVVATVPHARNRASRLKAVWLDPWHSREKNKRRTTGRWRRQKGLR